MRSLLFLLIKQCLVTVRGLKMFEKKFNAPQLIKMTQPDNQTMFVRSTTAFFQIFFNPLLSAVQFFFSVNSPRNFIFSFCALAIISSFIFVVMNSVKNMRRILQRNLLIVKGIIFRKASNVNNFICTIQLHCIFL